MIDNTLFPGIGRGKNLVSRTIILEAEPEITFAEKSALLNENLRYYPEFRLFFAPRFPSYLDP